MKEHTEPFENENLDPFENETWEFNQNPYPALKLLQQRAPIYYNSKSSWWIFTKFDDIYELLHSQHLSNRLFTMTGEESSLHFTNRQVRENWVMNMEGQEHSRLRKGIQGCFAHTHVISLIPFLNLQIESLIANMLEKNSADLVADLAIPLPIAIIQKLLDTPSNDRQLLTNWCKQISGNPAQGEPGSMEVVGDARDYFEILANQRANEQGFDVISKMMRLVNQKLLTKQETVDTCILMLFAAFETTAALIANGLHSLLSHQSQLEALLADSALIDAAIDEMLRYDTPAKSVGRAVLEPFEYKNISFKHGDFLHFVLSAANRDPSRFTDPDIFNISRERKENLSFGSGVHYCIGTTLAKLTARLAITALLVRFPRLTLTTDRIIYNSSQSIRMVKELPVFLN